MVQFYVLSSTLKKKKNTDIGLMTNMVLWGPAQNYWAIPNPGPSEERPVRRETTYEALLNPNNAKET